MSTHPEWSGVGSEKTNLVQPSVNKCRMRETAPVFTHNLLVRTSSLRVLLGSEKIQSPHDQKPVQTSKEI